MSIRVSTKALKSGIAAFGLISSMLLLAGCTSSRFAGAPLITNSVNTASNANLAQQMPDAVAATDLPPAGRYLSASNSRAPYIPAGLVGQGNNVQQNNIGNPLVPGFNTQVQAAENIGQTVASQPQIMRQQLPDLSPNLVTSTQTMPAMPKLAEVDLTKAPLIDNVSTGSIGTTPRAVPENSFMHVIQSGESLYAIARNYDVTTDAIVSANGLGSPDKIFVGQEIIIPGRPGMVAPKTTFTPVKVASLNTPPEPIENNAVPTPSAPVQLAQVEPTPVAKPEPVKVASVEPTQIAPTPIARPAGLKAPVAKVAAKTAPKKVEAPKTTASVKPVQTAAVVEPTPVVVQTPKAATGNFRWPVKGRVITDFRASKNTGLNIEVPEGSSIRAAENGEVIYVGNAVQGFGNLILIKHSNGYVSAYAHLKDITVAKGTAVNRGDSIGTAGMTGAVSRPQLHFELRQGATPVDPMPLLAS